MTQRAKAGLAALLASSAVLAGCGNLAKVNGALTRTSHQISANQATVKRVAGTLLAGAKRAFVVTYVTTGGEPLTVTYAARGTRTRSFQITPKAGPPTHLIVNRHGEYSCAPAVRRGAAPTCQKLNRLQSLLPNQQLALYTPAHWAQFLEDYTLTATYTSERMSKSVRTVNGFSLHCVNFTQTSAAGTSTICATRQGQLGYAKLAGSTTAFEIQSYSGSPSPSLFGLPAGSKVTVLRPGPEISKLGTAPNLPRKAARPRPKPGTSSP